MQHKPVKIYTCIVSQTHSFSELSLIKHCDMSLHQTTPPCKTELSVSGRVPVIFVCCGSCNQRLSLTAMLGLTSLLCPYNHIPERETNIFKTRQRVGECVSVGQCARLLQMWSETLNHRSAIGSNIQYSYSVLCEPDKVA